MAWILFLFLLCGSAYAAEIPCDQAVRCIIGEASGEGYKGMLAVAAALRNRGTTKGVYGCKAKHVDTEPAWVWDLAKKAWIESALTDPTNGADHWESILFKTPEWAPKMEVAYRYKNHIFYKERR